MIFEWDGVVDPREFFLRQSSIDERFSQFFGNDIQFLHHKVGNLTIDFFPTQGQSEPFNPSKLQPSASKTPPAPHSH